MTKSVLIVAGETSGDILGAEILEQWKKLGTGDLFFWGFGGSNMKEAGVEIIKDIKELSVIGFWEGLTNYNRLSNYLDSLVLEAVNREISGAILIDYPGFNLKLAEKLNRFNIPVYQVVSPQIWAWHYNRIFKIKKFIKNILCLYKFELDIYTKEDIPALFIGHPIVQKIEAFKKSHSTEIGKIKRQKNKNKKIALLPGSRKSEIRRHLPFLIEVARKFHEKYPDTFFEIPSASEHIATLLRNYHLPEFISVRDDTPYLTLATSDSGIVCSGTATLECSLFNLPFLLIYKTSWITYFIGKKLIRIPYIGLVNILRNSFITKEFIQSEMDAVTVLQELEKINFDKKYCNKMLEEFKKVEQEVYGKNPAQAAAKFFSRVF